MILRFDEFHILDTGFCLAREGMLIQGGSFKTVECRCMVGLLKHPIHGWGLWDTGYAPRMWEETRHLPNRIYRWAAPLPAQPDRSVLSQLGPMGIDSNDVRWIVLSHLHGDHVSGLRDFPRAKLYVAEEAYEVVRRARGVAAVMKAYLPNLLPEDFADRAYFLRALDGPCLEGIGQTYDLFGDGAALLFPMPGHARGQLGMLAETSNGSVILVADAVYHRDSLRREIPPGKLTNLIADDASQVLPTIRRLSAFTKANPDVRVFPTHCSEAYRECIVEGRNT
jgi:glyoxylase-like metal-dependent hydrolase (beta-lactamase superfamily II)